VKTSVTPQRRDLQQQNRHCSRCPVVKLEHELMRSIANLDTARGIDLVDRKLISVAISGP